MTVRSTVIIGAGIAGLYTGIQLLWAGCRDVVIYEKYNYVGGRVVTSSRGYEIGAGRIHVSHSLVRGLIKRYGLKWSPLSDVPSAWIERAGAAAVENTFEDEMPSILGPLMMLDEKTLAENTVGELLCRVHGARVARDFVDRFPYYTEVWSMRADMGLLGFMGREGFGTIRGGIGSLIRAMREEFERLGGIIHLGWTAVAARPPSTVLLRDPDNKIHTMTADVIVFALHASALKRIDGFSADLKRDLGHLKMAPLVRIYAEGKWPAEMLKQKIVTRSPLRYIIPVAPSRGLIMISYTDGDDTLIWAKGEKARRGWEKRILTELRRLMGDVEIPEPTFMKAYPWADGTTYWVPGNYDVSEVAQRIMVPRCGSGRMYICGESISVGKQAWMEGALETAADVVKIILGRARG